jgi:hypothetical protein
MDHNAASFLTTVLGAFAVTDENEDAESVFISTALLVLFQSTSESSLLGWVSPTWKRWASGFAEKDWKLSQPFRGVGSVMACPSLTVLPRDLTLTPGLRLCGSVALDRVRCDDGAHDL